MINYKQKTDRLQDAVEVACEPSRVEDLYTTRFHLFLIKGAAFTIWLIISVLVTHFIYIGAMSAGQYFFVFHPCLLWLVMAGAVLARNIAYNRFGKQRKAVVRFTKFFSMFKHIETLVLHDFKEPSNVHDPVTVLEIFKKALKGVHINTLEVRETWVDARLWLVTNVAFLNHKYCSNEIIALCRDHKIRRVQIFTSRIPCIGYF